MKKNKSLLLKKDLYCNLDILKMSDKLLNHWNPKFRYTLSQNDLNCLINIFNCYINLCDRIKDYERNILYENKKDCI